MSTEVELYKEFGAYERHFNTMQGICRSIASTWLLATIAGIGHVLSNDYSSSIIEFRLGGSIVASAGAVGIFLLWLLDVQVYHRLLLAVFDGATTLEKEQLRLTVRTDMESALHVRWFISLFYGVPMACLSLVAIVLAWSGSQILNCVFLVLAVTTGVLACCVLATNRRPRAV